MLHVRRHTEGAKVFQPKEEKGLGTPYRKLLVFNGDLKENWRGTLYQARISDMKRG